jgi:hypothetical protein
VLGLKRRDDRFADMLALLAGIDADRDRALRSPAMPPDDKWGRECRGGAKHGPPRDFYAQSSFSYC